MKKKSSVKNRARAMLGTLLFSTPNGSVLEVIRREPLGNL